MAKKFKRKIIETYSADIILRILELNKKPYITIKGYNIKRNVQTYKLFQKQRRCVKCTRSVYYAVLENCSNSETQGHFKFYSSDRVLMTKDHIIPRSKGGSNTMDNYQTMCHHCNLRKGDKIINPKKKKKKVKKQKYLVL